MKCLPTPIAWEPTKRTFRQRHVIATAQELFSALRTLRGLMFGLGEMVPVAAHRLKHPPARLASAHVKPLYQITSPPSPRRWSSRACWRVRASAGCAGPAGRRGRGWSSVPQPPSCHQRATTDTERAEMTGAGRSSLGPAPRQPAGNPPAGATRGSTSRPR